MTTSTLDPLRSTAVKARHRIFEALLTLDYDNLPYMGHLVTRIAAERGYTDKRKNLKGNTLLEWSRSTQVDGPGTPNQWATLAAVDLLVEKASVPDADDNEFWQSLLYHWHLAHGPYPTATAALLAMPEAFHDLGRGAAAALDNSRE